MAFKHTGTLIFGNVTNESELNDVVAETKKFLGNRALAISLDPHFLAGDKSSATMAFEAATEQDAVDIYFALSDHLKDFGQPITEFNNALISEV